ncbi:MAG: hypothetical protein JW807_08535 [Spirochaetes bacterium]|nr:hypothetical protein [Spirochaetota bacterium]
MRLLTAVSLFVCAALPILSCKPQAALTPQAAFHDLRAAFRSSDAASLERQLSQESLKKISRIASLFSRMEERQLEALSGRLGLPAERLKRLSVRDYCAIILSFERGGNAVATALRYDIVGVDRDGVRALVRVENGMELTFVKEGPYWKFDMAGL